MAFEAEHPGVTVEISTMQHEDMPDVYMEGGGGERADHVAARLTKDLTDPAADVNATLKHFVADPAPRVGRNHAPVSLGPCEFEGVVLLADEGSCRCVPGPASPPSDPPGPTCAR